jgi:hypothetical protein
MMFSGEGVIMRVFILLLGLLIFSASSSISAPATPGPESVPKSRTESTKSPYYVEFRVAKIGLYGHSYVAYGRIGAGGKPKDVHYADLHPVGNYALMGLGHLVPVPATTVWDPEVARLPVYSAYQHRLTAEQYARLVAAVKRARENKTTYWNAVTNNCNHFVAELARTVGLRTPNDFQVSYTFIPALRDLNSGENSKAGRRAGLSATTTE